MRTTIASTAILAAMIFTAQPAQADSSAQRTSIPTGASASTAAEQARVAVHHRTGEAAIKFLGDRLARVAAKSHVTPDQLRKAFRTDHTVQVDDDGNVMVADALGGSGTTVTTGSTNTLLWPIANTLTLHSRASATRKIYLDFNGHTTSGTQWNTDVNRASFNTPAFSRDGDTANFNVSEAAAIQAAYASVAEDFAPFDVDVTTEPPGVEALRRTTTSDTSYGIRVVIGPNTWLNVSNSGYAKIGSFNWASDTPAYCFVNANTPTKQIAECISHETGHTVGLYHDGLTSGAPYYGGHNNWAPIMGNSYGRPVTQWSKGQYSGANNTQDDLYVIGDYLGWVADDYVGTTATTVTLPAGTTRFGRITWGSGESDAFKFSLGSTRTINIQSWEWIQQVDTNLNMRIRVTNSAGTVLASNSPTGNTRTNLTITLAAGTYYVFLDGVGEGTASTGYTNYASMGFYNLLLQFV